MTLLQNDTVDGCFWNPTSEAETRVNRGGAPHAMPFAERCRQRRTELRRLLMAAHPDRGGQRATYDDLIAEYQTLRRCQYSPCGRVFKVGTNSGQWDQRFCSQCCGSRYRADRRRRRLKAAILWAVLTSAGAAQAQTRETWSWSEAACIDIVDVPVLLQWTWDRVVTPQTLPFEGSTVQWTLTGPSSFPGGPHHPQGYTLWLVPPVGGPMDVLAMEPMNTDSMHAEIIATAPGRWCGYARAVGTHPIPGGSLRPPGKPLVKGL